MLLALPYEVWRDVKDYEGLYQVSNMGNVKSLDRIIIKKDGKSKTIKERVLSPNKSSNGYLTVQLYPQIEHKRWLIHRLVAQAFIPNPYNLPQIDHINAIRDCNKVDNLRWVTVSENKFNPITRKHNSEAKTGKYGKLHPRSKPVLQYDLDGNYIREWENSRQIERVLGKKHSNITACCRGKRKTAVGYIWKYKSDESN